MKKVSRGLIAFVIFNAVVSSFLLYKHFAKPKFAYVIIEDVFNGFEMKKELESKYKGIEMARKKIVDSLEMKLKILNIQLSAQKNPDRNLITEFEIKKEEYYTQKQRLMEDNATLTKQYDEQIISQINQYIKDYGKENSYAYIFGNGGSGSLLYGEETENITSQLSAYINNKYKGVK